MATVLYWLLFLLLQHNIRQKQLKKGKIYLGSLFKDIVHCGWGAMEAGTGGTGYIASTVRKQREVKIGIQIIPPFYLQLWWVFPFHLI